MITIPGIMTRFLLGGAAVAVSSAVGAAAGGRTGGVFAAFPAVYVSAVLVAGWGSPRAAGVGKVVELSHGALIGMLANIVTAICASIFIRRLGVAKGLALALLIWLALSTASFFTALAAGWLA